MTTCAHPQALRGLLHPFGMQPTVSRHQPRRTPEDRPVMLHRGQGLVTLGLLVGQDVEAGDDATLDLVEDHLSPELDGRAQLAPLDDPGVRLEQAEHFRGGGDRPPVEHTALGLPHPLLHQREEAVELREEALRQALRRRRLVGATPSGTSTCPCTAARTCCAWRTVCRAISNSRAYSRRCAAGASALARRRTRWSCWSTRRVERTRLRKGVRTLARGAWTNSGLARRMSRVSTRTPSPNRPLSVG